MKRRVATWKKIPSPKSSPRPVFQLEWEAEIIEYVNFIWQRTRSHKKGDQSSPLPSDIPLLGPRFLPPTYLHVTKRPGNGKISPETIYLKPLNIIHPFYYSGLAQCPRCNSEDDITWEGWTGTGAREVHGISYEEVALGLQLRCNACKAMKSAEARVHENGPMEGEGGEEVKGHCFALTSNTFWTSWKQWEIPRELKIDLNITIGYLPFTDMSS